MNDPEYLAHVADRAEELAGQLHAALTQVIVERIMIRLKQGVDYRLTASDKWMLEVLQEAGYLREDLMKELSDRTGVILKEMSDAFEDAAVEAIRWDDAVYKAAGLNPTPLRQSPHLMRLVQRDYQKTKVHHRVRQGLPPGGLPRHGLHPGGAPGGGGGGRGRREGPLRVRPR